MDRETVLTYLNGRLRKPQVNFDDEDINFIYNFIHYRTGELIPRERIINGIATDQQGFTIWYDAMLTFLVNHFKIETEVQQDSFGMFLGQQEAKIITAYK